MSIKNLLGAYQLSWLNDSGEERDIVLSSRIRLARNFRALPFPNRADFSQLGESRQRAVSVLPMLEQAMGQSFDHVSIEHLTDLEKRVLIEKHLISQNLVQSPQCRSVFVSQDRRCSIMVNEEDHLRIQCMAPGFDLATPYTLASGLDDVFESKLDIAFDEKMGYLTSCPTNLGTGLRASVMLHLPGLVFTRNIGSIINISPQLGLAVRGLYGEGNDVVGNIFQIANQLTLGFTESEITENLTSAVKEIIAHERRARKALQLYTKERLEDEVWRAFGTLKYARFLSDHEVLSLGSKVRLGIDMGLIDEAAPRCFNELLVASRTGYLQNLAGNENLSQNETDRKRAELVRRILSGEGTGQE